MNRFKNSIAGGALVIALVAGASVAQDRPESILPPGFNETQPAPPPAPAPAPQPVPDRPQGGAPAMPLPSLSEDILGNTTDEEQGEPAPPDAAALAEYELPSYARRSLDLVGIVAPSQGGLPIGAFGSLPGRVTERLMGRLDAPIGSRWMSIVLRRALASQIATPRGVNGADFAAERAWLLLRMGEAQVARALVEAVDSDNYTPKMYEASLQVALATGDPALVCPVAGNAPQVSADRAWVLAGAICGALSGVAGEGPGQLAAARRRGVARGIDLLLAQNIVGSGTRRGAVTIEWDGVDRLTSWRYGLATAGNVDIPAPLLASAPLRVQYWRAQAPQLDPPLRASAAELAAAQGVLSSAALVDLFSEIDQGDAAAGEGAATARLLRTAYGDQSPEARIEAMRTLWDEPKSNRGRYARLVLTARAAAALTPATTPQADRLIASMLSAGYTQAALAWRKATSRGSDGWAMLTLADASGGSLSAGEVRSYRGGSAGATAEKRQMYVAAVAGLGRVSAADAASLAANAGLNLTLDNAWTRAIDRAAAANDPGAVILLAAVGMQTPGWQGVGPDALYRIIAAMHRVGLDAEARMIAIEALTRL